MYKRAKSTPEGAPNCDGTAVSLRNDRLILSLLLTATGFERLGRRQANPLPCRGLRLPVQPESLN